MAVLHQVEPGHPDYPLALQRVFRAGAPAALHVIGDAGLLQRELFAVFCSRRCPGELAALTYDLAQHLRDAGAAVAGGFHSPMEKECLNLLLRSPHPVVIGAARSLEKARRPREYRRPLTENRLLWFSPCPSLKRATRESARFRNRVVAALATHVFVAYAEAGGATEGFCREALQWGKRLYTFESERSGYARALGARPIKPSEVRFLL